MSQIKFITSRSKKVRENISQVLISKEARSKFCELGSIYYGKPNNQIFIRNGKLEAFCLFFKVKSDTENDFEKSINSEATETKFKSERNVHENPNAETTLKTRKFQEQENFRIFLTNKCNLISLSFENSQNCTRTFQLDENPTTIQSFEDQVHEATNSLHGDKHIHKSIYYTIEKRISEDIKVARCFKNTPDGIKYMNKPRSRTPVELNSTISVRNRIIRLNVTVEFNKVFTREIETNLKRFMINLNKKDCKGKFYLDSKIYYVSTFYAMEVTKYNGCIFSILQEILIKEINPNIEHFASIINKTTEKPTIMQSVQNDTKIEMILSEEQISSEREILKRMSEDKKTIFFNSRFLNHKIRIINCVIYYFIKNGTIDLTTAYESKNELYGVLHEIAQELSKYFLGLKSFNIFELFRVFQDKPVFMFQVPLSDIIQIYPRPNDSTTDESRQFYEETRRKCIQKRLSPSDIEKYKTKKRNQRKSNKDLDEDLFIKAIKLESVENLRQSILQVSGETNLQHFSQVHDENTFHSHRTQCYKLQRNTANIRMKINKPLCLPFIVKIEECLIAEGNQIILIYDVFEETLEARIKGISPQRFKVLVSQLLGFVQLIQMKDSDFTCFDISCFGYDSKNNLRMLLKAPEELEEEFLAPEVGLGRSSKTSIIFSLGKLVEKIVQMNSELLLIVWAQKFISLCTKTSIFERGSLKTLLEIAR